MDSPTLFSKNNHIIGTSSIEENESLYDALPSFSSNLNFNAPVKTTDQLHQGLITAMGQEQGEKMYEEFIKSIITMSINTLKKEIDRAQRAAKRMRSIYRDSHG